MSSIYIGEIEKYKEVSQMFDDWRRDISSIDVVNDFETYWNRRISSPILTYDDRITRISIRDSYSSYYLPFQLKFTNDKEKTWGILKNSTGNKVD